MGSSKSLPSIYCTYKDKCPSRTRSRICVPCIYKSRTGQTRLQCRELCINNPNLQHDNHPIVNVICEMCSKCSCAETKMCDSCHKYMSDFVYPPSTSDDRLKLLKPFEPNNTFSKW